MASQSPKLTQARMLAHWQFAEIAATRVDLNKLIKQGRGDIPLLHRRSTCTECVARRSSAMASRALAVRSPAVR